MNANELAKTLTLAEGGKKSVDIAQIKEILSKLKKLCKNNADFYKGFNVYLLK